MSSRLDIIGRPEMSVRGEVQVPVLRGIRYPYATAASVNCKSDNWISKLLVEDVVFYFSC